MTVLLLDRFLAQYDAVERHETLVDAPAHHVYVTLRNVDLGRAPLARALLLLRGMPLLLRRASADRPASTFTLQDILASGFVVLAEEPDREIVLGLVGRFWTLGGGIRRISPSEFAGFAEPGYAKAAWNFYLVPQTGGMTHLVTETRVLCTDEASRRAFLRYWRLISPFSGLIRRQMLATVQKEAERDRHG